MLHNDILLVDDDPFTLKAFGSTLKKSGYEVTAVESGEKAFTLLDDKKFNMVITDLVMEQVDGIDVLKKTKRLYPKTLVLILTGHANLVSAIDALRLNADDYILKPCEADELLFRIKQCFEKVELSADTSSIKQFLPVCCVCKRIRDDSGKKHGEGAWYSMEDYLMQKMNMRITHTFCPKCERNFNEEIEGLAEQ